MQNAFVFFTIMGQFFSTNYDITLCSNIDVHCGGPDVVESITQTENRPEASSDQERENSSANEDISVRNADPVTSDELIEDTSQDSSKREDKSTQVDEDIAVHESGPVTSDGRIEEISNNFSYELNDKSTQVDEDIAVQEPCQVASNGQTDRHSHESSDQVRNNSGDELRGYDSDASTILRQFETNKSVIRQKSALPRGSNIFFLNVTE